MGQGLSALHKAIIDEKDYEALASIVRKSTKYINSQEEVVLHNLDERRGGGCVDWVTVNQESLKNATPLHLAILKGDVKLIELLLENGADPSLTCSYNHNTTDGPYGSKSTNVAIVGANALHFAMFLGDKAAVASILRHAPNPKELIEAHIGTFCAGHSQFSPDTGSSGGMSILGGNALHLSFFCGGKLTPAPTRKKEQISNPFDSDEDSDDSTGSVDFLDMLLEFNPILDGLMHSYETHHTNDGCFHSNSNNSTYINLTPLHLAGILRHDNKLTTLLKV